MKLTWLSNAPWASTGYGNQTRLFLPRIQSLGHDVACIAFYGLEGGLLDWHGIRVYPKGLHPYGQDIMAAHTAQWGAWVMISLMDTWVVLPQMMQAIKWVPWFPVDMDPLPPPVARSISQAFKRIVFSRFGERMVNNAGMDCYYVPHGVETKVFRPVDRVQARQSLRWPADKFIVGMVAANKGNPSRKAFMPQLEAYAEFHKRHPDTLLYLHTTTGENGEHQGVNLPEFIRFLGMTVGKDVIFMDQYSSILGMGDDYMVAAYNAMDVHMLVSMGEGFGIPTLEAQSCGCPVIVGDWTAMSELCFSGWKVDQEEADKWWTPLASYQWMPRVGPIVDRLEAAYRMQGNTSYRDRARQGALAYDADKIAEKYWKPTLAEIEAAMPARLAETI